MKKGNAMNDDTCCALCYADVARRTAEAIRIIGTTMPDPATDPFTDGYLRGILFHWHLRATEAGLPARFIQEEESRLQQLTGRRTYGD